MTKAEIIRKIEWYGGLTEDNFKYCMRKSKDELLRMLEAQLEFKATHLKK